MRSRPIFILGMHRSGTSALAGTLNLMGVYLGPENQMLPAADNNPKGFWEFIPFMCLNEEILRALGHCWNTCATAPAGWENLPILDPIKDRARSLIKEFFKDRQLWGFKDPRTCLTLPFWGLVVPDQIECILCIRNPLDVSKSLLRRHGYPIETNARMWALNVVSSLKSSFSLKRHVLWYEDLMRDPEGEIKSLEKFLGYKLTRERMEACVSYLDVDLKHEDSYPEDVIKSPELPEDIKEMYLRLRGMIRGNQIAQDATIL